MTKKIGYVYPKIRTKDNLKEAHKNAKKDKKFYRDVQYVDEHLDECIEEIQEMLDNKTYIVGKYTKKVINDKGKERLILKLPYYPDRIIQWAILLQTDKDFQKMFCFHSCASITGAGNKRIQHLMKKYRKYEYKYCLKLDVKKFYPNIDREILKKLLRKKFKDTDLLWLLDIIIDSSPLDENSIQDERIRGIPIGSYLSQYLANFYLVKFDHWLKEEKKVKAVVRYMDDIIILGNDKKELFTLEKEIEEYLWNELKLLVKENWQVFPIESRSIDFIGYKYTTTGVLVSKTTEKRFKKLSYKIQRQGKLTKRDYSGFNSYLGLLEQGNCKALWEAYYQPIKHLYREGGFRPCRPFNKCKGVKIPRDIWFSTRIPSMYIRT